MENNIHIVRFKDGTDVICEMEELDSFQIKITNPMMFAVRSSNLILQHWLPVDIMKGDAVAINTEDVLCVFKPTDEFVEYYLNTVDKMNAVLKNKSNVKEEEINMMEVLRDMESIKGNLLH
jgi:predicted RecB family endonuclease